MEEQILMKTSKYSDVQIMAILKQAEVRAATNVLVGSPRKVFVPAVARKRKATKACKRIAKKSEER